MIENMADEADLENLDFQPDGSGLVPVEVKTEDFNALAISMYEMPGLPVMGAMYSPGPVRSMITVNLFLNAINDPLHRDVAEGLSFNQLQEAVESWVQASNARQTEYQQHKARKGTERIVDSWMKELESGSGSGEE